MKKIITFALSCMMVFSFATTSVSASDYTIKSETYVVINATTGQVLLEKDAHNTMYPASITKIMTAALALIHGNTADFHTMTTDAVFSVPREATHIALTQDEIVPVNDLLHATMLQSANDAANGLAEYIAGDTESFGLMMTAAAKEAGANSTNFVNGSGLHDDEHYTTAYDMAMISKWALGIDGFKDLWSTREYTMAPTNKQLESRTFYNKHQMLTDTVYYEPYVKGGKNGWTPESQNTLVTYAEQDGTELICVTMKSEDKTNTFTDAKALLENAFEKFKPIEFPADRVQHEPVNLLEDGVIVGEISIVPQDLILSIPNTIARADISVEVDIEDQYNTNDKIEPQVKFLDNYGTLITTIPLEYEIEEKTATATASTILGLDFEKEGFNMIPVVLFSIATIALIVSILFAVRAKNLHEREKKLDAKRSLELKRKYPPNSRQTPPQPRSTRSTRSSRSNRYK